MFMKVANIAKVANLLFVQINYNLRKKISKKPFRKTRHVLETKLIPLNLS